MRFGLYSLYVWQSELVIAKRNKYDKDKHKDEWIEPSVFRNLNTARITNKSHLKNHVESYLCNNYIFVWIHVEKKKKILIFGKGLTH